MILKKPYAFLIKHFRIIHLLLLIPMIYLVTQSSQIVDFLNSYVSNGYRVINVVLSELASSYVNIFMYLATILILVVLVSITILLERKEKPTRLYKITIIYYIIIFVLLTASFSMFKMIEADILDSALARIIRDLSYIVHFSQYIFIIFILMRGVGFNIKQFNFQKDLEHFEVSSEDSEEFEFTVGIDTYKTKRTLRRFIREFKYYFKENKFIFMIIIIVAVIAVGTSLYVNRETTQVYNENSVLSIDYFNFTITDTYISGLSSNGEVIKEDKVYLIVKFNLKNRYYKDQIFSYNNIQLIVNKEHFSPNLSYGNYFTDFGNPFSGTLIKANYEASYIMVYEIDKYLVSSNFSVTAYTGSMGKKIKITPIVLNNDIITNYVNKGADINLESTNLKLTTASILDYEITNRFEYSYKYCLADNNCINSKDAISLDYGVDSGKTLMVMDYRLALDDESSYMYYQKTYKNFFEDFMKIKYTVNGVDYYSKVSLENPDIYSEKLVTKISNKINQAENIEAIISVRNVSYRIKLK